MRLTRWAFWRLASEIFMGSTVPGKKNYTGGPVCLGFALPNYHSVASESSSFATTYTLAFVVVQALDAINVLRLLAGSHHPRYILQYIYIMGKPKVINPSSIYPSILMRLFDCLSSVASDMYSHASDLDASAIGDTYPATLFHSYPLDTISS